MSAKTLDSLVARVGLAYGNYRSATATANGTTTTLVDAGLINDSGVELVGYPISIAGVQRQVVSADYPGGVITFAGALGGATANGVAYEVTPFARSVMTAGINAAIARAGRNFVTAQVDETLTLNAKGECPLPADCVVLTGVETKMNNGGNLLGWGALHDYTVMNKQGLQTLVMRGLWNTAVGQTLQLRLHYWSLPKTLTVGSDTTGAGDLTTGESDERELLAYVEHYALGWLHRRWLNVNPTGEASRMHARLMTEEMNEAMTIMGAKRMITNRNIIRRAHVGRQI